MKTLIALTGCVLAGASLHLASDPANWIRAYEINNARHEANNRDQFQKHGIQVDEDAFDADWEPVSQ